MGDFPGTAVSFPSGPKWAGEEGRKADRQPGRGGRGEKRKEEREKRHVCVTVKRNRIHGNFLPDA